jgi:2-isopropylmalate synthase
VRLAPHPLIYDWNHDASPQGPDKPIAMLDDETLRDGLQSPSVRSPTIEQKIDILHHMDRLGIDTADIGLPGAGPKVAKDVERLARAIADGRLHIRANCAARTMVADIRPIAGDPAADGVHRVRRVIGSRRPPVLKGGRSTSPEMHGGRARAGPEGVEVIRKRTPRARSRSRCAALYHRDSGRRQAAVRAEPWGTRPRTARAPSSSKSPVAAGRRRRDRLARAPRSRAPVASSTPRQGRRATRLHGAALGIGERCGNTPIDLLMVNLVMMGYRDNDLAGLPAYVQAVSKACDVRIAPNYPVLGADAFRTATGVHAAAVVKAFRMGDRALMDAVYAAVPASLVGRQQEIEVGPMSGRSNVIFWLESRGLPASDEIVDRIFAAAKSSNRMLTHEKIQTIIGSDIKVKASDEKAPAERRHGF